MRHRAAERVTRRWTSSEANAVLELENGSRMDQRTFHALYLKSPEGFKAELIGGTVYVMSSPVSPLHGRSHFRVGYWLGLYSDATPGTDVLDNTTSVLGSESEPQPDVCLLLLPDYGGQAKVVEDKYISGPLDLVVEVAITSRAIDLGAKKRDYEQAGVREYVVVLANEKIVRWFHRKGSNFIEVAADEDGLFRSKSFAGLWLDPRGLFSPTTRPLTIAVKKGLASPEHAAFVAALKSRRKKSKSATRKTRKK